jgi:hypothetical protein
VARYERGYTGERMTEFIGLHVTPSLRAKLKAAAEASGAPNLNTYLNELLENRPGPTARTRRNPQADELRRELRAIGVNLNQLLKFRHSTGEREREPGELDALSDLIAEAVKRVIAL